MESLNLISSLDVSTLLLNGFYIGVLITCSIGFLGYGINYALKLFNNRV